MIAVGPVCPCLTPVVALQVSPLCSWRSDAFQLWNQNCLSSFLSGLEAEKQREYSTTTACKVCSGEGTVILQHGEEGLSSHTAKSSLRTEVPSVLRLLWACEPLLCVLQPCTPSSSQQGPPHHQCPHHTRGCGVSAGPAWCPQRPSAEQKAKKILKNSKTKQDRPLMLEQWLSGLELKIEIYGYTVQVRGGRGLYTWDRLCTRSQRAAALPVTRFVKKKKINTTMCLKNNKCCSSHSCRLSLGCQGVSQPGLDVWSEQGGAAVPWDAPG